jgi:hypothetical protein
MPESAQSVRFVFEYDGDAVRVVSRQPVDMIAPASSGVDADLSEHHGFWVELQDQRGTALHRQVMHNPMRTDAEVFSDDPDQTLRRVAVGQPTGAFTVVVPDLPEADHLALVSSPPRAGGARTARIPAARVRRFPLRGELPSNTDEASS